MDELSEFELQKSDDESAPGSLPPKSRPRVAWIIAAVAVAAGVPAYLWIPKVAPETPVSTAPTIAYRPLPTPVNARPAIDVPPLDQTDALVRRLVEALSSHPRVVAWLTTSNLIRTLTVAVENIDTGATPARHLRVLRPAGPFRIVDNGEAVHVDTRSYERYNGIADAFASIDADGAASLYQTLRERFDEAYRELGHQEPFDAVLGRAIATLVRVPTPRADVLLVHKGALNAFADPRLEELTAAQQQLLRMGPRNLRVIQEKLREIAGALGMPV
jgi:hypothetical protein